jgi:hypothetical protein
MPEANTTEPWGHSSPWPMKTDNEGLPVVLFKKPAKATTWRTCPECGDRGTKILNLSAEDPDKPYQCQCCRNNYAPPPPEARRARRDKRAWWLA